MMSDRNTTWRYLTPVELGQLGNDKSYQKKNKNRMILYCDLANFRR